MVTNYLCFLDVRSLKPISNGQHSPAVALAPSVVFHLESKFTAF